MASNQWRAEGEPRLLQGSAGDALLQYMRGPGGVGAHQVQLSTGEMLTMLPESTTTARKRTGCVSVAVEGKGSLLAAIIGELVLAGATNLLLDGEPLIRRESTGRWIVELVKDGEVEMRYVADVNEGATADEG